MQVFLNNTVHIIHPIEFNNILESLRAVNTSIGKISENNPVIEMLIISRIFLFRL